MQPHFFFMNIGRGCCHYSLLVVVDGKGGARVGREGRRGGGEGLLMILHDLLTWPLGRHTLTQIAVFQHIDLMIVYQAL